MIWPDFLIVLDDTDSALGMKDVLEDLSWLKDPRRYIKTNKRLAREADILSIENEVKNLPNDLLDLRDPHILRGRVTGIKVDSPHKIHNAVSHLTRDGSAIAFIDFAYGQAPEAQASLIKLYDEECPEPWKIDDSPDQKGGCFFSSSFNPTLDEPVRLLCPTTQNPPERLGNAAGGAVTKHISLQSGTANMMRAAVFALKKWIELQKRCPLDEIWEQTQNWFRDPPTSAKISADNLPHSLQEVTDLRSYRETLEEVFGILTPTEWWEDFESVSNIHESLKHLCGWNYCGTATTTADAKYNLCIGAAYLIALLALRDARTDSSCEKLTADVRFKNQGLAHRCMFLPMQSPEAAKKGARSLYYLLRELFIEDPKFMHRGRIPTVEKAYLLSGGSRLLIKFDGWDTSELAKQIFTKLRDLPETVRAFEIERSKSGGQKLAFHLFCMWEALITNSRGFGSPGTIWMEQDKLYIQGSVADG